MQPVVYHVAISADGFICRPSGAFDFFPNHADATADYLSRLATYGTVLMGRHTYEVGVAMGVTNPYPMLQSYVFSTTLGASPDPLVTLVSDDAVGVVRGLRAREGGTPIYLCGGGVLAGHLFRAGLVDELILKVNPVLIGAGRPLVESLGCDVRLVHMSTTAWASGTVVTRYRVER